MINLKIRELLSNRLFNNDNNFGELLSNSSVVKKYSIMRTNNPYPVGEGFYRSTFCFFFYSSGCLIQSFYCELKGYGEELRYAKINCYQYPCNDVGRSDDWEWVDVVSI